MDAKDKVKWYYQPLVVILLIALFLGPFGLPLVFKSPKFSKPWKWIITVLTFVYTAYLMFETYRLTQLILGWLTPFLETVSA